MEVVNTASCTNTPNYEKNVIRFINAGVRSKPREKTTPNALSLATDWELRADLETRLKFQDPIAQTSLRLYILIFSNKIKKILIWELTVPWEEHVQEVHERKKYEYDELLGKCKNNGLYASCAPIAQGVSLQGLYARPCQTFVWQEPKKESHRNDN